MTYTNETRRAFEGLIEKPALTDELLNKPPFKFIVDIVSNTNKKSSVLTNSFKAEELDSKIYTDKASKTAFLDKLIASLDDGSLGNVKSSKIVAGKEPESTNLLLQVLANKAKSSGTTGKPEKKPKSGEKKEKEKLKEENGTKPKKKEKTLDKDKVKEKEKEKDRKEKDPKKKDSKESKDSKVKKDKKEKKEKENREEPPKEKETKVKEKREKSSKPKEKTKKTKEEEPKLNIIPEITVEDNPIVVNENHEPAPDITREELIGEPIPQRPSTSARPRTASRPAPVSLKKKQIAVSEINVRQPVDSVTIFEEKTEEDPSDEIFAMEEVPESTFAKDSAIEIDEENMGGLVQKIMVTKAELEESAPLDVEVEDHADMQERIKIANLKKDLQNVTRQTYPIAQILEYAQEDIEMMIRELEKWRTEHKANEQQLKDMQAQEFGDMNRLSTTLSHLDGEIKQQHMEIATIRGRIAHNNEMILQRTSTI